MLSKYCSDIADKYGIKVGGVNRLVQICEIKKISFERGFFKLLINSIYGKCMENIRKRINVKLINNSKDYARYVSTTNFISQKTLSKNFVTNDQIKSVLILDKTIYALLSILELSKLLMYKFHYEYFKNKFDAKLLFTDTDSLVYEIKGDDLYEKSFQDKDLFDFSNYTVNSRYYDPKNNAVIGKMKDEFEGKTIGRFVGLKSKMYSIISADDEEVIKAKGVNKKNET